MKNDDEGGCLPAFCYKFSQLLSRKQDLLGLFLAHPIGVRGGLQLVARFWVRPAGPYHFVSLPGSGAFPSTTRPNTNVLHRPKLLSLFPYPPPPFSSFLFLQNALFLPRRFLGWDRNISYHFFPCSKFSTFITIFLWFTPYIISQF